MESYSFMHSGFGTSKPGGGPPPLSSSEIVKISQNVQGYSLLANAADENTGVKVDVRHNSLQEN